MRRDAALPDRMLRFKSRVETALAKPFISDSELCCVAGSGIVIAHCSVQRAVCCVQACQDWPAGRATLQLLNLYSLQVVKLAGRRAGSRTCFWAATSASGL